VSYEYPNVEDLLALANAMGVPHIRELGLLQSAIQRPQLALYGADMYPDLPSKCAALLESIVKNHPLLDGNKRLGWASVDMFLQLNGILFEVPDDEAYHFVFGVAGGEIEWNEMVAWFDERL
jgi:death-on-curing protein